MPLLFVDRNGHPGAMSCPMLICDVCAEPIHDGQNGFAARWRSPGSLPRVSPTYLVHSNPAQRCLAALEGRFADAYRTQFGDALLLTSNLAEVLAQLLGNFQAPVGGPDDIADAADGHGHVEYVAPVVEGVGATAADRISWSAAVHATGEVSRRTRRL